MCHVQTQTQGGCRMHQRQMLPAGCEHSAHAAVGITHNSGTTCVELPQCKATRRAALSSSQAFPGMRSKGRWATREAIASSSLDPKKRGVRTGRVEAVGGGRPTCAWTTVPQNMCRCQRVSSTTVEQLSTSHEEHLTVLHMARGACHTHFPGTQHPHGTYSHQPATVLITHRGSRLPLPIL